MSLASRSIPSVGAEVDGLLIIKTRLAPDGPTVFPPTPRSHPFRLLFLVGVLGVLLVQSCVDPEQERSHEFDFVANLGLDSPGETSLFTIAGQRWLQFIEKPSDITSPSDRIVPLLPPSHDHRHCRGYVRSGTARIGIASLTACGQISF